MKALALETVALISAIVAQGSALFTELLQVRLQRINFLFRLLQGPLHERIPVVRRGEEGHCLGISHILFKEYKSPTDYTNFASQLTQELRTPCSPVGACTRQQDGQNEASLIVAAFLTNAASALQHKPVHSRPTNYPTSIVSHSHT